MSREERRQYARMTRGMDRSPALPPAARARAERNAARRAARQAASERPHAFTLRFWVFSLLVAAAVGYLAFSVQWPQPHALMVGVAVAAVTLAVAVGLKLLRRRAAARN